MGRPGNRFGKGRGGVGSERKKIVFNFRGILVVPLALHILNVYGFIHFSRTVPDGKDVNRSFPGNKNGSLASRMANYVVKDIIPKIDYGIDFQLFM